MGCFISGNGVGGILFHLYAFVDVFSLSRNKSYVGYVQDDDGTDPVTDLPTYAMQRLNPYPFGIDPVSK